MMQSEIPSKIQCLRKSRSTGDLSRQTFVAESRNNSSYQCFQYQQDFHNDINIFCSTARLVSLVECLGLVGCRVTVFCGLGVASYPQPPDRSQHGCTVGIDRDPPMWHLHRGRVVELPERQLLRTSVLVRVLLYILEVPCCGGFTV